MQSVKRGDSSYWTIREFFLVKIVMSAKEARYTRWLKLSEQCKLRFKRPRGYRMDDYLQGQRMLGFRDAESETSELELTLEVFSHAEVGASWDDALAWCRQRLSAGEESAGKISSKPVELGDESCARFEAGSGSGGKQIVYLKPLDGGICCFWYQVGSRDARKKQFDEFAKLALETLQLKGSIPAPARPAVVDPAKEPADEPEPAAKSEGQPAKPQESASPAAKSSRASTNGRVQLDDAGVAARLPGGWQRQDDAENVIVYAPVQGFQPRIALFTESSPQAPWRGTAGQLQLLCEIYREMCSQIEIRAAIRVQHGGSEGLRLDWSGVLARNGQQVSGTVVVIPHDRHAVVAQYLAPSGEVYREYERAYVGLLDSIRWPD